MEYEGERLNREEAGGNTDREKEQADRMNEKWYKEKVATEEVCRENEGGRRRQRERNNEKWDREERREAIEAYHTLLQIRVLRGHSFLDFNVPSTA